MSTATADRGLFARLIDDAAVFPPGMAPLPEAVAAHRSLRSGPDADLVGPLLVSVALAPDLPELLGDDRLPVALVARAGTALERTHEALTHLRAHGVEVAGVELAHQPGWEAALSWRVPVTVEVPRRLSEMQAALAALAATGEDEPLVRAKLRTQATEHDPVPTARELAEFVTECVDAGLPFKLTGGLHHALPSHLHDPNDDAARHGVLTVLLATEVSQAGAAAADVADVLALEDPVHAVTAVCAIDADQATVVRASFTSFGCCGVGDPLDELRELGLIS